MKFIRHFPGSSHQEHLVSPSWTCANKPAHESGKRCRGDGERWTGFWYEISLRHTALGPGVVWSYINGIDVRSRTPLVDRPTNQRKAPAADGKYDLWVAGWISLSKSLPPSSPEGRCCSGSRERAVCSDGVRWWGQRVAEAEAMMFESIVGVFFKWRRLYVRILSSKTSFKRCPFSSLYRKFRSRSLIVELPCCLVRTGRQNCGPWWREMVILLISAPISCGSTHAIR